MTRLRRALYALSTSLIFCGGAATVSHAQWYVPPGGTVTNTTPAADGGQTITITMPDGTQRIVQLDKNGGMRHYTRMKKVKGVVGEAGGGLQMMEREKEPLGSSSKNKNHKKKNDSSGGTKTGQPSGGYLGW